MYSEYGMAMSGAVDVLHREDQRGIMPPLDGDLYPTAVRLCLKDTDLLERRRVPQQPMHADILQRLSGRGLMPKLRRLLVSARLEAASVRDAAHGTRSMRLVAAIGLGRQGQHDKAHLPLECAALVLQKAREDRDESACELGGGRHIDPSSVLNWGRHMTGQFDDLYLQAATSKLLRKAVGPRALFFEKALPPLVGDWWRQMAPKSLSSGGGAVWNNVTSALLLHWRGFPREEVRIL